MSRRMKFLSFILIGMLCVFTDKATAFAVDATIEQFTYTEQNGVVTITDFTDGATSVNLGTIFPDASAIIIKDYVFDYKNISSVTIPKSVSTIGKEAFKSCSSLQTVTFEKRGDGDTLVLGASCFRDCGALTKIELPEGCKMIPDGAFYRSSSLTSITIPDTCERIGESAFYGCSALNRMNSTDAGNIILPTGCQIVGESAFDNCKSVNNVYFSENCGSVGDDAFAFCSNLRDVTFANSDTMIADAFPTKSYAKNLTIICEKPGAVASYASSRNVSLVTSLKSVTITQLPSKTEYYYGDEEFDVSDMKLEVEYANGDDIVKKEIAVKDCYVSGYDKNKVGKQTITVFYGGMKATFDINVQYDFADVTINAEDVTYTGAEVMPVLTVKRNSTKLVQDKDYTITCSDNINVGTATAVLTGIGNYKGEQTVTYQIVAPKLSAETATVKVADMTYTGSQLQPVPDVLYGEKLLIKDTDYKVTYGTNVDIGEGLVIIEGIGSYTGSMQVTFKINAAPASGDDSETGKDDAEQGGTEDSGKTDTEQGSTGESGKDDAEQGGTEDSGKDDTEQGGTEESGKDDAEQGGTEDSGKNDTEQGSTGESGKDDAEQGNTEDSGKNDTEQGSTGESGKDDVEQGGTEESGKDDAEQGGTEDSGKNDTEQGSTGESGKDDAEQGNTEDSGKNDTEQGSTGESGKDDVEQDSTEAPGKDDEKQNGTENGGKDDEKQDTTEVGGKDNVNQSPSTDSGTTNVNQSAGVNTGNQNLASDTGASGATQNSNADVATQSNNVDTGSLNTSTTETTQSNASEKVEKGKTYIYKKLQYEVTGKDTVTFVGVADNKLKKVIIPDFVIISGDKFLVTKIAKNACYKNSVITSVSIANYVTEIGSQAFAKCTKVKTIEIGSGLKKIEKKAFYGAKKLKIIIIRSTKLTFVGKKAVRRTTKNVHASKKVLSKYKVMFDKAD